MMIAKKMTWILATLLILVVTGGCGQPKSTPEEAALIYCNAIVKQDFTDAKKIGLSKEEQNDITAGEQEGFTEGVQAIWSSLNLTQYPQYTDSVADSLKKINHKIEFKSELVSKDSNSAVVKVMVRTIDGKKFLGEIIIPALTTEAYAQLGEHDKCAFVARVFSENIDKATLVNEAKPFEMKFTLNKKTNCWEADKSSLHSLAEAVNWQN